MTLKALQRIDDRAEKLKHDREAWLHAQGWRYSSNYPGSLWLWSKEFPQSDVQWRRRDKEKAGFVINGASTEVAIIIEGAWLSYYVRDDADPAPTEDTKP